MKCFVCKTGNLVLSGSHEYCDNCDFRRFVVTEDYIDSCIKVLATLVSNTKFNTSSDAAVFIHENIRTHLPMLFQFVQSLDAGLQRLSDEIINQTFTQAVNLQIGDHTVGEVEEKDELTCQCGSDRFEPITPFEIGCSNCGAIYKATSESGGRYEPEFLCECGWAAYEVEEGTNLVHCCNCDKPYLHVIPTGTFEEV